MKKLLEILNRLLKPTEHPAYLVTKTPSVKPETKRASGRAKAATAKVYRD
ncbi:hypothetical protein [Bowdeniella nasicola]|nr:hypothetical protein [Bowdeniella nasicola]